MKLVLIVKNRTGLQVFAVVRDGPQTPRSIMKAIREDPRYTEEIAEDDHIIAIEEFSQEGSILMHTSFQSLQVIGRAFRMVSHNAEKKEPLLTAN
jgi:hypothetical protein